MIGSLANFAEIFSSSKVISPTFWPATWSPVLLAGLTWSLFTGAERKQIHKDTWVHMNPILSQSCCDEIKELLMWHFISCQSLEKSHWENFVLDFIVSTPKYIWGWNLHLYLFYLSILFFSLKTIFVDIIFLMMLPVKKEALDWNRVIHVSQFFVIAVANVWASHGDIVVTQKA